MMMMTSCFIQIQDIPLSFNSNNKTNSLLPQKHNIVYYWYFVMATCFGLSLDRLQTNVLK